jgi:uncharacterized membrane protein YidH (DUF202 family)
MRSLRLVLARLTATNTEESMKPVMLLGVVLIVIGVLALAYQGITYTTREKVIDLGPLQASVDKKKTIPLPPILGALALGAGLILVVVGNKRA